MTAEELLAAMAEPLAEDGTYCTIDPETRVITIPPEYQLLGVESDEKAERLYFQCPKIVGDNIDLSTLGLRINFQNANMQKDQYIVDDVQVSGDMITFSWLLFRRVTQYRGDVSFIVCAVKTAGEAITNEWNTTLATAQVLEGLEVETELPEEETDVVNQLIAIATQRLTDVQNATSAANTAASNANQKAQEAENAAEDARDVIEQITKDSYLHTALQSFIDTVTATPTAYGNAIVKKIEGFTRQQTPTGAQLFDASGLTAYNGATISIFNGGKEVRITGRKQSDVKGSAIWSIPSDIVNLLKGKTAYVYVSHNAEKGWVEFGIQTPSGWDYPKMANNQWTSVQVPSDASSISLALIPNNVTETDVTATFQNIKIGLTQFETWEPYTGGQPAPNPDYPMEVQGTGYSGFFDGETDIAYYGSDGVKRTSQGSDFCGMNPIPCKTGDTITFQYKIFGSGVRDQENFRICFYDGEGAFLSAQTPLGGITNFDSSMSFTAPSNAKTFTWCFTYTPWKRILRLNILINNQYAICVKSTGPNIFNKNCFAGGSAARATVYDETVQIKTTEGSGNAPGVFFYLGPIANFLGKRLYIKADKMESTHSAEGKASCRIVLRAVKGGASVQSFGVYQDSRAGTWHQFSEIPEDIDLDSVTDLALQLYVGDGTAQVSVGETATFENVMLCEEQTDKYHPYQSNVTYIPVDYPLFEGDKIIQRNGEYLLVRKRCMAVFDGSSDEAWGCNYVSLNNGIYNSYIDLLKPGIKGSYVVCDRFDSVGITSSDSYVDNNAFISGSGKFNLMTSSDRSEIQGVESLKTWLQSNPVTVVYELETPTEESLSPEAQKALHSIMATDEQTELTIVGVPADAEIQNQFLLPRNEDGALNTTAYCTAEKNKIVLNELVAQNLDARVNKLEIDNAALAEQTIIVE